jgi:hypothetical protein
MRLLHIARRFRSCLPALLPLLALSAQAQSPRALEVLHERLLPVFETAGVVFTDADESTGRLRIGVVDRDVEPIVRERLPALGVLSQLVDVVETEPIFNLATLRDYRRPVPAGVQIRFSNYVCTLGFPATRNGVMGFVTNSHCSGKQGTVDGMLYYQPLNQTAAEFIGKELIDPKFFKNGACPRGRNCRYSDSIFVKGADNVGFALGTILTTTGVNTGSLDIAGSVSIAGIGSAAIDDEVNKVGRTTGWTRGRVAAKCANVAVSGSNVVNLCQDIVENPDATIVGGGDSGSSVWTGNGGAATLVGLLWGGNSSGSLFVYSPISAVLNELGGTFVVK